jgi:hypothetical protein
MTERLSQLLRSLRDVEGVVGSFVWGKRGEVIARDLPAFIDESVLEEVGPRIERIYEAYQGAGDELDGATLVFADYKLHLRELDPAFIAVLSGPEVNSPALKMAMHLVGRNVTGEIERMNSVAPPPPPPEPEPEPAAAVEPKEASTAPQPPAAQPTTTTPRKSRLRFWRGSRIRDERD